MLNFVKKQTNSGSFPITFPFLAKDIYYIKDDRSKYGGSL